MKPTKLLDMRKETLTSVKEVQFGTFTCNECGEIEEKKVNTMKHKTIFICKTCRNPGLMHHKLYRVYCAIIQRTTNPNNKNYINYGGRGIVMCEYWKERAVRFIRWALSNNYAEGLTIERKDNDKGYSPDNCIFATRQAQIINRRKQKDTASIYRGLTFRKERNTWVVRITIDGKVNRVGSYKKEMDAAIAYNKYVVANNLPHKLNNIEKDI